jgi:hypothetical protein
LKDLTRPSAEVWHLFIGTKYYWQVTARKSGRVTAQSVVRRFTATTAEGALQLDFVPSTDKPPLVCGIRLSARE